MAQHSREIGNGGSLGADWTSPWMSLESALAFSILAQLTGTPNGTLSLQYSNDRTSEPPAPSWTPINVIEVPSSSRSISAAGSQWWDISLTGALWVRMRFVRSSGTGTINAQFNRK